jgi:hypothetical protein
VLEATEAIEEEFFSSDDDNGQVDEGSNDKNQGLKSTRKQDGSTGPDQDSNQAAKGASDKTIKARTFEE